MITGFNSLYFMDILNKQLRKYTSFYKMSTELSYKSCQVSEDLWSSETLIKTAIDPVQLFIIYWFMIVYIICNI